MTDVESTTARGPWTRIAAAWRGHPQLVDAVIAGALWILCSLVFVAALATDPVPPDTSSYPPPTPTSELLALFVVSSLQTIPLAWRRTRPEAAFAVIVLAHLGQLVVSDSPLPSNIAALMAAYALPAYSTRPRVRTLALVVAGVSGVLATRGWAGYNDSTTAGQVLSSVFLSGTALVCWLSGDLARKRRELVSRGRARRRPRRRRQCLRW